MFRKIKIQTINKDFNEQYLSKINNILFDSLNTGGVNFYCNHDDCEVLIVINFDFNRRRESDLNSYIKKYQNKIKKIFIIDCFLEDLQFIDIMNKYAKSHRCGFKFSWFCGFDKKLLQNHGDKKIYIKKNLNWFFKKNTIDLKNYIQDESILKLVKEIKAIEF